MLIRLLKKTLFPLPRMLTDSSAHITCMSNALISIFLRCVAPVWYTFAHALTTALPQPL